MKRASTLARRLSLAVLLVGALGLLLQGLLLLLWLEPMRKQLIEGTVMQVEAMDQALRAVAPAQREAIAQRLSNPRVQLRRLAAWPAPSSVPTLPLPADPLRQDLRRRLPAGAQVEVLRPGRDEDMRLQIAWRLDGEVWQAGFAAAPPLLALGLTITSWLLLMGLLAGVALWLTVRVVTRPIEQLAAQIATQRERLQPLPLTPGAGAEISTLVAAFNTAVAELDARSRERQQLLAGVSHDLRTPLARLRLRIETQLDGPTAEALEADVRAIQHIVEQFLQYVQGETAPRVGPPAPLLDLVHDIATGYSERGLQLDVQQAIPLRSVPETALRRLLVNLIDNAFAHGAAPVRLRVEANRIAVEDGGPGLTAAQFEQARQPFVRLHEDRGVGHCGLGLAIAGQMARQLGGQLGLRERRDGQPFAIELLLP